jgi:hypothetical protein
VWVADGFGAGSFVDVLGAVGLITGGFGVGETASTWTVIGEGVAVGELVSDGLTVAIACGCDSGAVTLQAAIARPETAMMSETAAAIQSDRVLFAGIRAPYKARCESTTICRSCVPGRYGCRRIMIYASDCAGHCGDAALRGRLIHVFQ